MEQTQSLPEWVKTHFQYKCAICGQPFNKQKGPHYAQCPNCGAEYTDEGLGEWCQ